MSQQLKQPDKPSNWTTWAVSITNGFWGDYLLSRDNGLAVEMAFYHQGRPLSLSRHALRTVHAHPTPKVCVLIHGLGCNELLWQFLPPHQPEEAPPPPVDYGHLLQTELGYTPFYLRYNTGLSVAQNGRSLGRLLETLFTCYPTPIEEITVIGHSMGGLVVRSACYYAIQHDEMWVQRVNRIFYLGTPHDGADLARLAHATETVLRAVPNPVTRIIGDFFGLRSQGIKDLSHGTLIEPDVFDDGFDDSTDSRPDGSVHHHQRPIAWLPHADHYLAAGTVNGDANHIASVILGDGLVGAPINADNAIPVDHIRLFPGIHHLQLARHWEVYQQIKTWQQAQKRKES